MKLRLRARGSLSSVTLAAVLASAVPVRAQGMSSESAFEERRGQAKVQFEKGAELYKNARYDEAVRAFLAADRLAPSPALSFNIARAYERIDDSSAALRWYRDYLRRSPDANNAGQVRERVTALDASLAGRGLQQITVLTAPPGATIAIDGHAAGVTPYTGDLPFGEHTVVLAAEGYKEQEVTVRLSSSAPQDLNVNLAQAAETPALPMPLPDRSLEEPRERPFGVAPYIVGGAGIGFLGAALGLELARRSQESKADSAPQTEFQSHVDSMNGLKTASRVTLGIGIAGVVTGGVLILLNHPQERPVPVAFGCFTDGCSASAQGVF